MGGAERLPIILARSSLFQSTITRHNDDISFCCSSYAAHRRLNILSKRELKPPSPSGAGFAHPAATGSRGSIVVGTGIKCRIGETPVGRRRMGECVSCSLASPLGVVRLQVSRLILCEPVGSFFSLFSQILSARPSHHPSICQTATRAYVVAHLHIRTSSTLDPDVQGKCRRRRIPVHGHQRPRVPGMIGRCEAVLSPLNTVDRSQSMLLQKHQYAAARQSRSQCRINGLEHRSVFDLIPVHPNAEMNQRPLA